MFITQVIIVKYIVEILGFDNIVVVIGVCWLLVIFVKVVNVTVAVAFAVIGGSGSVIIVLFLLLL